MFNNLRRGLEVFEDRHCGRAVPGLSNEALPVLPTSTPPLPPLPVPVPIPTPTPVPLPTSELEALIPDELLDRINKFAFNETAASHTVPAPPCRRQPLFDYAGERTQYPHVKAGAGR